MTARPTTQELKDRIQSEISHFGGALPERVALVWGGYLAGLLEWGLLVRHSIRNFGISFLKSLTIPLSQFFWGGTKCLVS